MEAAEWDWKKRAEEISEGKRESMLTILEKRGLVDSVTGWEYSTKSVCSILPIPIAIAASLID